MSGGTYSGTLRSTRTGSALTVAATETASHVAPGTKSKLRLVEAKTADHKRFLDLLDAVDAKLHAGYFGAIGNDHAQAGQALAERLGVLSGELGAGPLRRVGRERPLFDRPELAPGGRHHARVFGADGQVEQGAQGIFELEARREKLAGPRELFVEHGGFALLEEFLGAASLVGLRQRRRQEQRHPGKGGPEARASSESRGWCQWSHGEQVSLV